VEYFSAISAEKTEFFFYKLQELLSSNKTKKYLSKKEGSKLNRRRFNVAFLNNITKIQTKSKKYSEVIQTTEINFNKCVALVNEDIKRQDEQFHNKLKQKLLRKTRYKKKKVNLSLDEIVNEFIRKFHYHYYSRVVSKPMQVCVNMYNEMYNEKISITKEFDAQIKEFELLRTFEDSSFL
jgi:hypothetical protein